MDGNTNEVVPTSLGSRGPSRRYLIPEKGSARGG
jgi:hypothetical protein